MTLMVVHTNPDGTGIVLDVRVATETGFSWEHVPAACGYHI